MRGSGTYYGLGYKVDVKKNLSAEYGVQLEKVEMYMFNKFITGAIAEVQKDTVTITDGKIENYRASVSYHFRFDQMTRRSCRV